MNIIIFASLVVLASSDVSPTDSATNSALDTRINVSIQQGELSKEILSIKSELAKINTIITNGLEREEKHFKQLEAALGKNQVQVREIPAAPLVSPPPPSVSTSTSTVSPPLPPVSTSTAADGYTAGTDGNSYKFHSERLTWDAAEDVCAAEGASLAMEKTDATHSYIKQTYQTKMWIGVTDKAEEGALLFVDGTPVQESYWGKGEPNNADGNEDCVEMNWRGTGKWNDAKCNHLSPFLCQKRIRS